MSNQSADAVFDALGEPVRRRILELLREGPMPVGRLAERLPVGRPAVSKHLRVLSNAGLIQHRSAGTRNLYALAPDGMAVAQQWLVRTWDTGLAAYAAAGAGSGRTLVRVEHTGWDALDDPAATRAEYDHG
jgi:DNA-binding transcriptional ArsR family regulator